MRPSMLYTLAPLVALIAVVAIGCDKPESPGEPESTSAMADQEVRADFDGKLEVVVNALEPAGEHSNLEVILENVTDESVAVARTDFQFASDSGDWFAAKTAPDNLKVAPGASEKATVTVAMPAAQLNVMNVGNIRVELPDAPQESADNAETPEPSGDGIHKLESTDDENSK